MTPKIMHVNGSITDLDGKPKSLKELQKIVGGYIEFTKIPNGDTMVVNEEGIPKGLPINPGATLLAKKPIFGDVIVCPQVSFHLISG